MVDTIERRTEIEEPQDCHHALVGCHQGVRSDAEKSSLCQVRPSICGLTLGEQIRRLEVRLELIVHGSFEKLRQEQQVRDRPIIADYGSIKR